MPERIDAYVRRLRERLGKKLPNEVADQKAEEIRSHLASAVEGGTDERRALLQIGSERLVAGDLIRAESGVGRRSAWRWAAISILLLAFSYLLIYRPYGIGGEDSSIGVLLLVVTLGVFVAACVRSRKWLVFPVAAAAAVISGATLVADAADQKNLTPEQRAERVTSLDHDLEEAKRRLAKAEEYAAGQKKHEPDYLQAPKVSTAMVAYSMPILSSFGRPSVEVVSTVKVDTQAQAEELWRANGAKYKAWLADEVGMVERSIEFWKSGRSQAYLWYGIGILTAIWLVVLTLLNGAALAAVRIARRVAEDRWKRSLA